MSDAMIFFGIPAAFMLIYLTLGVVVGTVIRYSQLRFPTEGEDSMSAFTVGVLFWPLAIGMVPYLLGTWLYEMEKRNGE